MKFKNFTKKAIISKTKVVVSIRLPVHLKMSIMFAFTNQ